MAYPEVEKLPQAEDQGQAIVNSTQRPLQGAFLIPPVLPVVLIAGISATGKSSFCNWLAEKKGFIHVDMELPDDEPYSWRSNGLRDERNAFCNGSDRAKLLRALKARTPAVSIGDSPESFDAVLRFGFAGGRREPVVVRRRALGSPKAV